MTKQILRRLRSLEIQRANEEHALYQKAYVPIAIPIVLAFFLGGLKSHKHFIEAFARALKYETYDDLVNNVVCGLVGDPSDFQHRYQAAYRRLFELFLIDVGDTPADLTEAICEIAGYLPEKWKRKIDEQAKASIAEDEELNEAMTEALAKVRKSRVFTRAPR